MKTRQTWVCVALVTAFAFGGTTANASPGEHSTTGSHASLTHIGAKSSSQAKPHSDTPQRGVHLTIGHARFEPVTLVVQVDIPSSKQSQPSADAKLVKQLVRRLRRNLELFGIFRVLKRSSKTTGHITIRVNHTSTGHVRVHMRSRPLATSNSGKMYTYLARVHSDELPRLARRLADHIYQQATGRPGPFLTTHIAAVTQTGGHRQIVLLHPDGGRKRQVTNVKRHGTLNILPRFSRKGDALYWTTYKNMNPDLVRLHLNLPRGSQTKPVFVTQQPGINASASEALDGTLVLTLSLGKKSDIYRLNSSKRGIGGSSMVRLTTNPWKVNLSPDVSSNGDIVYLSANLDGTRPRVYLMNADGSNQRPIVRQGTFHQSPRFSPDGRFIAFTARDEFKQFDIFLFHVKTRRLLRITQGQGDNREPAFSPDGQLLVYTRAWKEKGKDGQVRQRRELFVSTLDGTHQRQLTTSGPYWTPTWGPVAPATPTR